MLMHCRVIAKSNIQTFRGIYVTAAVNRSQIIVYSPVLVLFYEAGNQCVSAIRNGLVFDLIFRAGN